MGAAARLKSKSVLHPLGCREFNCSPGNFPAYTRGNSLTSRQRGASNQVRHHKRNELTREAETKIMAKVFTLPVKPNPKSRRSRQRMDDTRYVEGQRLLVEAMKYLTKSDKDANRSAIELLFDHFQSNFRVSDTPLA